MSASILKGDLKSGQMTHLNMTLSIITCLVNHQLNLKCLWHKITSESWQSFDDDRKACFIKKYLNLIFILFPLNTKGFRNKMIECTMYNVPCNFVKTLNFLLNWALQYIWRTLIILSRIASVLSHIDTSANNRLHHRRCRRDYWTTRNIYSISLVNHRELVKLFSHWAIYQILFNLIF